MSRCSRMSAALVLPAVLAAACVSVRGRMAGGSDSQFTLAGGRTPEGFVDVRTPSAALDRITKRRAELSGTARRTGTGRGVAVYVFDGGVAEDHAELAGRVRIGFDGFPSTPRVCNPHGTAVAGAAAGATLGVAPNAEIIDVKIINCEHGRGTIDAIVAAARWTADDHKRHPGQPAVANWSFIVDTGHVIAGIDTALAVLHDAGILVVVSAGNVEIDACRVSPANSHGVLVVGASSLTRAKGNNETGSPVFQDVRASETAWGRCIDVFAPGDSVLLPTVESGVGKTAFWSGTSMAAGYVSGAASLVLERAPATSPELVMQHITTSATAGAVDQRISAAGATSGARGRLLYVGPN
jgi:subtilisin family serine protease